ncbi:MAG: hypothetical protein IJA58_06960, partial [Lachnospiraceae bacterium]|nr:hypothetical protein [Lachnospiraceae bacterium]
MKKNAILKIVMMMVVVLLLGSFAISASAAKEMFREVGSVGVNNVVAPVPGQCPDYNAQVVNTGAYEIAEINWYRGQSPNNQYLVNASDRFDYDTYYTVQFTLQAKSAYSFKTGSSGTTAVTGTVNGSTASVREV